jgi:C_GCAxxG_C_C family probable redox protein
MSRVNKALLQFGTGCNCCQSIVRAFSPDFGLDADMSLKLGGAFGGGMSGFGNTCGAVTGALMVIGLAYRNLDPEDADNKEYTYEIGEKFLNEFSKIHGSVMCRDLTGVNMLNTEELEKAKEKGVFEEKCPNYVQTSAELLEKLLKEYERQ